MTFSKPFILPVILSGGVGSRLWPLSREAHPKPFIELDDGQSLIQKTYLRALEIEGVKEVVTVTNRSLFFYTKDAYHAVEPEGISHTFLLEPFGRNSAAAIALAAHYAEKKYGLDCILLVLSSDHLITNQSAFLTAVSEAAKLAETGKLVTFGITPNAPKTGFGYIEAEGHHVKSFKEKPSYEQAEFYLEAGNYYWNSGMFCMETGILLEGLERHVPRISKGTALALAKASYANGGNWVQFEIQPENFESIEDISIDYALFEKSEDVAVVPCDIGWSDIGSWLEFGELHPKDNQNNHVLGEALLEDTKNCIVHSEDRLVATLGIEDLIIADTPDALLVAHRSQAQDVRKIVSKLKAKNHPSYQLFPTVHRPWGNYTVLQEDSSFKLKRIEVFPGASLSLQSHCHRSEHWIVVSGIARITNGDEIFDLTHNQSTYIPAGNKHRLENPSQEPLILMEVQCGSYLGEDDIIRYEDVYGRHASLNA